MGSWEATWFAFFLTEVTVRVLQLAGTTSPTLEGLPIEQRQGNILEPDSIEACMEGMEAVIHCAASTQVFPPKTTSSDASTSKAPTTSPMPASS